MRPDQLAVFAEERVAVLAGLEKLPENYRLPLILFYREEKSARAVAKDLGLSESVVRKRLSRGREMLREHVMKSIGSVLRDSLPGALFTTAVAASIGALAPPSAVAATAFSASASSSSASGAAVPIATTMTTSKFTLTTAALISLVCLPIGYAVCMAVENRSSQREVSQIGPTELVSPKVVRNSIEIPESELVLAWRQMKEEYGTDGEGLRAMYGVIRKMERGSLSRKALMSTLIAEWAQQDPGGIAFFRAKGRAGWERDLFMEEAVKADGDAFVDGLMASGPGWKELANHPLAKIAEHAPGRFLEIASLVVAPSPWTDRMREAFEVFATGRPRMARAAAEAMSGERRKKALAGVAMAWARTDGEGALAWADSLEDVTERDAVTFAVFESLGKLDLADALEHCSEFFSDGERSPLRSKILEMVLLQGGEDHFEVAANWLKNNPGEVGDSQFLYDAVSTRLMADPNEFLSQLQEGGALGTVYRALSKSLLNEGAAASKKVWEWTLEQEQSASVLRLRENAIYSLSRYEPQLAMSLIQEIAPGAERENALKQVFYAVGQKMEEIAVFDSTMKDVPPEFQSKLALHVFDRLSNDELVNPSDWTERLQWVEEEKRPESVRHLAKAWALTDVDASREWVESLENSAESAEGVGGIAAGWFEKDRAGAEEWASELEGAKFDAAASGIAEGLWDRSDIKESLSWLDQVQSTEKVYDSLELFISWLPRGAAPDTLEWIAKSSLSSEQKSSLGHMVETYRD